jgi:transposase
MRLNWLSTIWGKVNYHCSPQCETLKQLAHNYDSVTNDTVRVMNRLKSIYRSRPIACTGRELYYKGNRDEWLTRLTEEGLRLRAEFLYKQLDHLRELRRDAKTEMLRQARRHKAFERLCGVAGLGPVRVAQILAAVGSPHRFKTKRQFWSYCGLSVVTHSSSDYTQRITMESCVCFKN